MRIKHFSKGKFYLIACPPGTRVIRCWEQPARLDVDGHDLLLVPFEGREIRIPAEPSELLPLLAEAGLCGLSLIGGPEPELMLAGAACPNCGEYDVDCLSVEDGDETAHCVRCGGDFGLGDRFNSQRRSGHGGVLTNVVVGIIDEDLPQHEGDPTPLLVIPGLTQLKDLQGLDPGEIELLPVGGDV